MHSSEMNLKHFPHAAIDQAQGVCAKESVLQILQAGKISGVSTDSTEGVC